MQPARFVIDRVTTKMGSMKFLDADYSLRKDADAKNLYPNESTNGSVAALTVPQVDRPAAFLSDAFENMEHRDRIKFAHGTTTMAFKFKHGVIVAVDSRASMGQCM